MINPVASVRIDVHAINTPGSVLVEVYSDGKEPLDNEEMANLLRSAYRVLTGKDMPSDT
jgi:hypothetical protein